MRVLCFILTFDFDATKKLLLNKFVLEDENEKQKSIAILKERMKDETKVKQWDDFFKSGN